MTNAVEIEEAAVRWLLRRSEPAWTDGDQAELDAWLAGSLEHKLAYWRMEEGIGQLDRMPALRAPQSARWTRAGAPLRFWRPAAIAAAVAAAALPVVLLVVPGDRPAQQRYATAIGGRETVPLVDGSRLELNTQTSLRARVSADRREVWLDGGEAYFDIAPDKRHPFVVHAGPKRVTVLGTKFSVFREGDRVEVAVAEGRVRVEDADRREAVPLPVLTQGDLVVSEGGSTMQPARSLDAVQGELAWREGMLSFDQVSLAGAAAEFNRYNRKKLVVTGDAADVRIGGSFQAGNVDVFVRLLQRTYGLKVEARGNEVRISQ